MQSENSRSESFFIHGNHTKNYYNSPIRYLLVTSHYIMIDKKLSDILSQEQQRQAE